MKSKRFDKEELIWVLKILKERFLEADINVDLSNSLKMVEYVKTNYKINHRELYGEERSKEIIDMTVKSGEDTLLLSDVFFRRYWPVNGEYKGENIPNEKSLDILAVLLGYKTFRDFYKEVRRGKKDDNSFFDPESIVVRNLKVGEKITVGWFPIHYAQYEYLGKYKFKLLDISETFQHDHTIGEVKTIYGFGILIAPSLLEGYSLYPRIIYRSKDSILKKGDYLGQGYVLG